MADKSKKRALEMLHTLRQHAKKRKCQTFRDYQKMYTSVFGCKVQDVLSAQRILHGLNLLEFELQDEDFKAVAEHFLEGDGVLSFSRFFSMILKPLPQQRAHLCRSYFRSTNKENSPMVLYEKLVGACRFEFHFFVLMKWRSQDDVVAEMKEVIAPNGFEVQQRDWLLYWKLVSSSIENDDDFGLSFSKMFHRSFIPSYSLKKAQKFIKRIIVGDSFLDDAATNKLVLDVFHKFDDNHDGVLQFSEFVNALHDLGVELPNDHIRALFDHFDNDGDGTIDPNEFVQGVLQQQVAS